MTSPQPQRFGQYVVLDRIGDGGMAEIFLAKMQGYSGFEKLIALKKIHPKYSRNDTFAQMLIHEAKLAAALTHFNVVQVLDLGEVDEQVFIAMEYVRGRDLAAVLSNTYRRQERLPLELSLFVATEFMTGLEYAHRMRADDGTPLGIIHRDISPQNVLISYEGEVKVTDFGIARVISEKHEFQLPGNLHGKFGYMSPEQAQNREIDQRSDVFSAGVVLWEMLVGARLFRGRDQQETVEMVATKEVPPPSTINPDVPVEIDRICLKALARDRNQRYQTMGALLGELSRMAESLPRRAGSRDLSVYMRRQFGSPGGGFQPGKATNRTERSASTPHSGFHRVAQPTASSSSQLRVPIGQILLQQGAINVGDLELALAEQRAKGGRIGEVLVSTAAIDDVELAQALATQSNLPNLSTEDLEALPPPSGLLSRFPRHAAEASCILPLSADQSDRTVRLAVCDPYDDRGVLEAKVVLGVNDVALIVAPRSAIRDTLSSWYGTNPNDEDPGLEPLFDEIRTEEVVIDVAPPRVLIADADVELAEDLAERIRSEGYRVDVVHDGKTARSILKEQLPAVALMDAALPGIDGYNLLLELRSKSADAAVFITSNRGDDFRQAKAIELGADDFLVKPLAIEATTSKIRREVHRRDNGLKRRPAPVTFSGVSGSLEDMTVIDIAQSLELGRKTAHVVVQYEDGRQGSLRLDDGRMAGASSQGMEGPDAFYFLAKPGEGLFRIEYRTSPIAPTIDVGNTFLLIEAMRHLDEGTTPHPEMLEPASQFPTEAETELPPPPKLMGEPEPEPGPVTLMGQPEPEPEPEPLAVTVMGQPEVDPVAPDPEITAEHEPPLPAIIRGRPEPPSKRLRSTMDLAVPGIEPIPLPHPGLAEDLTLESAASFEPRSDSALQLDDWIAEQLDGQKGARPPASEGSREEGPKEVARISLRRVRKDEQ